MDVVVLAPYVGMVAFIVLAAWQARARSANDFSSEAGDALLRQNEALTRQLRDAQRDCRKAEQAYRDMVAWAVQVQRQVAQGAPALTLPTMPSRPINGDTPHDLPVTDRDEVRLRKLLVERMGAEDLKTMAFDLGCEDLRGTTQGEMARSLLDYVWKRRMWTQLLKWLAENRPDIQE